MLTQLQRFSLPTAAFFIFNHLCAQITSGIIVDEKKHGLFGVQVYFLNTTNASSTAHDGSFVINRNEGEDSLIIHYLGYQNDTILLQKDQNNLFIQLQEGVLLEGVSITGNNKSYNFSLLNPTNVETITSREFRKAACCSLAESFQSSNTVDLAYNNAVVGNREIQFLGLRGIYTQQLIENRPAFTGILSSFGYDFIPGTWLNEINIQKGAATVLHGAQSMTGAINSFLKNPSQDHRLFANLYADYHGRLEGNLHINKSWSELSHSGLYLHASKHAGLRDHNEDGFFDDATTQLLNGMWRNSFLGDRWEGQINFQALSNKREGGQTTELSPYSFNQQIEHYNLNGNLGFVGFKDENQNTGSIYDLSYSRLSGNFGNSHQYNSVERHALIQIIYTKNIFNDKNKITLSPSFNYNNSLEELNGLNSIRKEYNEAVPGMTFDYDLSIGNIKNTELSKLVLSSSQRIEYINFNKFFWTPRFSTRYNINEEWTTRMSVGRGYRFYRLISDQINLLTTNRIWILNDLPDLESSWNYGINLVGKPHIFNKEAEFNTDFYVTSFEEQLVVDLDADLDNEVRAVFGSLKGNSRAIVTSSSLSYPILPLITAKLGIRYQDTKQQLSSGFREQTMIAKWRGLLSLDIETKNKKWSCDLTTQLVGKMRLPDKTYFPKELIHEHENYSKPYMQLQTQINYVIKNWEIYFGCENMTNYTQHKAIINPQQPYSPYFSANEVYAPINGIKPFLGFKYTLARIDHCDE
ncbi:MAG: carboxypeptidase-like regulatory domain-containing protein [Saprospiraceae bacterium]